MQATHSLGKDFFAFGLPKIYILDSATNIDSTNIVSLPSDYIGAVTDIEISVIVGQEVEYTFVDGIKVKKDVDVNSKAIQVKFTLLEANKKNIEILSNNFNGITKEYRLELIYIYPNKVNKLLAILPRCKLSTDAIFAFNFESPMPLPVIISSLASDNTNWENNPIGKLIFIE